MKTKIFYSIITIISIIFCTGFTYDSNSMGDANRPANQITEPNRIQQSEDRPVRRAEPVQSERLEDNKIMLNFQNAQISDILDYLSETTGLVILSDVFIEGRISVVSKQPIDLDEAIGLINSILKDKNYQAIRVGRTLKLATLADAKRMNIPVSKGRDPEEIKAGDDMITHIIPILYANAATLRENLVDLLPDYAVLTANETSNSLILTDTTANIQRILKIIEAIDTRMAAVADVRVFRLVYANAQNTAQLINTVFEQQAQGSSGSINNPFQQMMQFGGRGGRGGRGGDRGGDDSSSSGGAGPNVRVVAAADLQTNAVVVSGPSDTLDLVADIIKQIDGNPLEERTIFVYTLKNAQAANLVDVLNNLFQELQQLNRQGTSTGFGGFGGRGGGRTATNTQTSGTSTSASDISDQVYLQADEDTNSLIILSSTKNLELIKKILAELDQPVPQVLIKVLIVEVTTSNSLDLGMEFSILNYRHESGQTLFETDFLPTNPTGGFITKILAGDLDLTLRALATIGKLNVLSRPYILTSNNQTATINVGQRVPFISDTRITETGQTINTITYEDIGISLEVTPNINSEGLVIMDVTPDITTTTADTIPISETVDAAVFATRSATSRVAILDGQTIVIGGLIQDTEVESVEKVPLVGDIPLLGELFKRTEKGKEKTELLIFLQPQVTTTPSELEAVSDNERAHSEVLNRSKEADMEALERLIKSMELTVEKEGTEKEKTEKQEAEKQEAEKSNIKEITLD